VGNTDTGCVSAGAGFGLGEVFFETPEAEADRETILYVAFFFEVLFDARFLRATAVPRGVFFLVALPFLLELLVTILSLLSRSNIGLS
jgi:hypothetical protein